MAAGLYEPTTSKTWLEFRQEYEKFSLQSMTVNERLFALNLSQAFESACSSRDEKQARHILERIQVDGDSIEKIIENQIKKS